MPVQIDQIEFLPIDKLVFDPDNPRLPSSINGSGNFGVLGWLLDDATIIELMNSIGEHDFFPGEPILVVKKKGTKDTYTVVEGNRRLAAAMLLSKPNLAPTRKKAVATAADIASYKPTKLPVIKFLSRDDVLTYLGYRHITGVKPWSPLAKAKYLEQLYTRMKADSKREDDQEIFRDLARSIGSRADYTARSLTSLALYNKIADADFFKIKGLDEQSISFSLLYTAINYKSIYTYLELESPQELSLRGLNSISLEELTSWLFERNFQGVTRLGESRDLKELAAIVENEDALKAFKRGIPLEDAVLLTEVPKEIFRASILEARSKLMVARNYIHRVDEPSDVDSDILDEIKRMVETMDIVIRERLYKPEKL